MGKAFFLLVDDDDLLLPSMRRLVEIFIKRTNLDAEIVTADSGAYALDLARNRLAEHPKAEWCLITDFDMPRMDGGQLIDAADALLGSRLLLRLVITGLMKEGRKELIEAKGAFIEAKPLDRAAFESYLNMFVMSLSR